MWASIGSSTYTLDESPSCIPCVTQQADRVSFFEVSLDKIFSLDINFYGLQNEIWERDKHYFENSNRLDFGKYNLYIWLSYSISFTSILIYFIIINARYKKASNLLKSLKNKNSK